MNTAVPEFLGSTLPPVRDDFIPREHYIDRDFLQAEKRQLWTRVWQMACRVEELQRPGAYVTYDIADQSLLVLRGSDGEIRAFHNVCPHRGNRILNGAGMVGRLVCNFHGWSWDASGRSTFIKDESDWHGCAGMSKDNMHLAQVKVGTWGGFVFVNMDLDAEPLESYLQPVPQFLDCLEFDAMRFAWYKTMRIRGNWKTAIESFMESYHVYTTHHQLTPWLDEISVSWTHGRHGKHGYPNARPFGAPSARRGDPEPEDFRQNFVTGMAELVRETGGASRIGSGSGRSADAVRGLLDLLPPTATPLEVHMKGLELMREAALADGAGWPTITPEQAQGFGVDWSLFPNMVLVFAPDSTLVFRARPDGDDPDRCLFDMWGLFRYGEGKQPPIKREFYEDWHAHEDDIPPLLVQDLRNIERIQRGMHSMAFKGSRPNPVQERQISNHHRALREYVDHRAEAA